MRGREVKNMNSSGDWLRRGKGLLAIVAASARIGAGAFASPSSAYVADATTWESLSTDLKNSSYGFFKWKTEYGKTQLERKVAADAAGILVNGSLPKMKATGKATSATSLNNFLQSVQSLVSINSWRQTLRTNLAVSICLKAGDVPAMMARTPSPRI